MLTGGDGGKAEEGGGGDGGDKRGTLGDGEKAKDVQGKEK